MAEAILSQLLFQGVYAADDIWISDIRPVRLAELQQVYGVATTVQNTQVFESVQTVILAIKPQSFGAIAAELTASSQSQPLMLSILAGVSLAQLESAFPTQPVLRVMPNTPATVGMGMTAIAAGPQVDPVHLETAQQIFQAVGEVVTVPEGWMDAVTGLSGSGPAFIALAVEALTDGGVSVGLPRAIASQLALQTVRGTAELMAQKNLHPAVLKDQVTSPGGTTIAGVASLEAAGFRSALIQAVQAAARRSQELRSQS